MTKYTPAKGDIVAVDWLHPGTWIIESLDGDGWCTAVNSSDRGDRAGVHISRLHATAETRLRRRRGGSHAHC